MNQRIHTPEGVRDIYGRELAGRLQAEERMRETFHRFGYTDIRTPSFEFYDTFSQEKGSCASRDMFKFIDRDGETLVLRPDMTPAIARCAVKYFDEERLPLRLCYIENTFINRTSLQGHLKEFTQAGAEFIGTESPEADGEILALAARCLLSAGLSDFQLEVGHVGFLNGLLAEAKVTAGEEETIRSFLENKNFFGAEEAIHACGVSPEIEEVFRRLPELFGDISRIGEITKNLANEEARQAVARLQEICDVLDWYGLKKYVSFDLGMVGRYRYYNGMIFKGYTYGSGEPVVTGGRYDNLTEQFGRRSGAVGFAVVLDSVMAALSRGGKDLVQEEPEVILACRAGEQKEAIREAMARRAEGQNVLTLQIEDTGADVSPTLRDCLAAAKERGAVKVYTFSDGIWKEAAL